MLVVDSEAAAQEIRRVLQAGRPGGARGLGRAGAQPVDDDFQPGADRARVRGAAGARASPGMFKLAGDGVLQELLLSRRADRRRRVTPVAMERRFDTVDQYLAETLAMSSRFRSAYRELELEQQRRSKRRIARDAAAVHRR